MEMSLENRQDKHQRRLSLRAIVAISFSVLAITAVAATIAVLYLNFRNRVREDLRQRVVDIANLAALQQNGDEFARITFETDPLYEKFRQQNLKIRSIDPEIAFVYTMRKDDQGIYFVVDAGNPGEEDFSPLGTRYYNPSSLLVDNFDTMETAIPTDDIYTDEYGSFLSAFAPIRNSRGESVGVIAVDIRADTVLAKENEFLTISLIIFMVAIPAVALAGWLFGNTIARPLGQLTRSANKIAAGDLNHRVSVRTRSTEIADLATDFNIMTNALRDLVKSLEARVIERTADLQERTQELEVSAIKVERRAVQLRAVALVAHAISSVSNLQDLLPNIAAVIGKEFGFYHAGIFLIDEAKENAVLVASNSEGGQRMLQREHKLKIGQVGIVGFTAATGQARIALDTGEDFVYFDNPDLPNTRSEMALPLRVGNDIIGVLDVQSEEPEAFDEEDIELLTIVADQVSIAIQNARQFQVAQKTAQEAEEVYRRYIRSEWRTLVREQKRLGYRYSKAGVGPLKAPVNSDVVDEVASSGRTNASHKETRSQIVVPIKLRGEVIGILHVTADGDRHWDQDEVDISEAVAERVALAVENVRLLESSQSQASRERTISEATSRIGASVNMRSVLQTAVEELGRIIPGSDIVIQLGQESPEK